MTDKYEEFKKYCNEQADGMEKLFCEFEKEQTEKHNEEEIKRIISRIMYCESYYYLSIKQQGKVSKIYDELKEKDLIK